LVAVALRHAHIDRNVGAARERHDVVDGEAPAPVLLGQTIDADPPAEAAAGAQLGRDDRGLRSYSRTRGNQSAIDGMKIKSATKTKSATKNGSVPM
jgi:hypothetical protein